MQQPRRLLEHPVKVYEPAELGLDDIDLTSEVTTTGTKVLVAGYRSFQVCCKVDVSATSTDGLGDIALVIYAPDQTTAVYTVATVFSAADVSIKADGGFCVSIGGNEALAVSSGTAATGVDEEHFAAPFMLGVNFTVAQNLDGGKTGTANLWLTCVA
jgi:hypothetical protein